MTPSSDSTLIVSPHLDDAVLGCGRWLAAHSGCTVVTVFAGTPSDPAQLTDWDARCGFVSAGQAIEVRRREDRAALAQLGATPVWLDFCDSQYAQTPSVDAVRDALRLLLDELRPGRVLYPLGLFHSDHFLVHDASRAALRECPDTRALVYEDALYRGRPGLLQQRLIELASHGTRATPARLDGTEGASSRKAEAVLAYASQRRAFGEHGMDDAAQPERFWTLEDAEPRDGR